MKKFSNKILVITFLVLLGLFVVTKIFRSPGRESNLDADVFKVDTARISRVELTAGAAQNQIVFQKNDKQWTVTKDETSANAKRSAIRNILTTFAKLQPERIVTRNEEKWNDYQVGDTTGTKVAAFDGDRELLSLYIGKEAGGNTYVRAADEPEVYAVGGSLQQTFNKNFSDVRDPSLLRLNRDHIDKITFSYPADSGFVVEKKDGRWVLGNDPADSTAVETYLNILRSRDHAVFANAFKPTKDPDVVVTFHEGKAETVLKGWNTAFYEWIYNSTRQPDTYFKDDRMVLAREILVGRNKFEKK